MKGSKSEYWTDTNTLLLADCPIKYSLCGQGVIKSIAGSEDNIAGSSVHQKIALVKV